MVLLNALKAFKGLFTLSVSYISILIFILVDLLKLLNQFYRRDQVKRISAENGLDSKYFQIFAYLIYKGGQPKMSLFSWVYKTYTFRGGRGHWSMAKKFLIPVRCQHFSVIFITST